MSLSKDLKEIDWRLSPLSDHSRPFYENDDPGHDWAHILRVVSSCIKIGNQENANLQLLLPAALLHDVVNVPKNHPDRIQASRMAAKKAVQILFEFDYSATEIEAIEKTIIEHSYSLGMAPSTIESQVLQDSDRLDAIGAIGVMRLISCGCKMGASYYDLQDPWALHRGLKDKLFSLDHVFTKLLKLEEKMNTKTGKKIAQERTSFLKLFVEQLRSEIH